MEKIPDNSKNDYVLGKYGITLPEGHVTWVTGSSSASLIGIEEYATKCGDPALVPTGTLLRDHNIVPLTGECSWGLAKNGVNIEHISGVVGCNFGTAFTYARDAMRWTFQKSKTLEDLTKEVQEFDNPDAIFSCSINHIKVPMMRLLQYGCLTKEEGQKVEKLIQRCSENLQKSTQTLEKHWKLYCGLLGTRAPEPDPSFKRPSDILEADDAWEVVGYPEEDDTTWEVVVKPKEENDLWEVVGIRQKDHSITFAISQAIPDQEQRTCIVDPKGKLECVHRERIVFYNQESIKKHPAGFPLPIDIEMVKTEVQTLLDCIKSPPKRLSKTQLELVEKPFPIIWGSSTIEEDRMRQYLGRDVEHLVQGSLYLGLEKDIQYAFTDAEHMKTLASIVNQWGVTVIHCKAFDRRKF